MPRNAIGSSIGDWLDRQRGAWERIACRPHTHLPSLKECNGKWTYQLTSLAGATSNATWTKNSASSIKASAAACNVHDSWDGFTRRVSDGASQAYGAVGGHRIDNVRQAMALSYPMMQSNLSRKWASINIDQILPVLLKLVQEVVMILGGSVALGGAIGGAVGSLAFGVGAAPGVVAGAMDCRRPRPGRCSGPGAFETAQRRSNRRTLRLLYQRCLQGV